MLEKIGLPPKPALKGNEWVLDASHCQGCSSAFTFFNRKHHCRRCGGIFCGNCTQQRIYLRGQGDAPVRVCDPCKKLEDAAKFESRYGHRNKGTKVTGSSKSSLSVGSETSLNELLGPDPASKASDLMDEVNELLAHENAGSALVGQVAIVEKAGLDGLSTADVTPEALLLQASEEKKHWLALKKEGKGEEALQAFKRSKELERRAETLKLSLRRTQRRSTHLPVRTEKHAGVTKVETRREKHGEVTKVETRREKHDEITKIERIGRNGETVMEDGHLADQTKEKGAASKAAKEKKDDLLDALKEMGWTDADLHDAGEKHNKAKSVESELAELAASVHQRGDHARPSCTTSMDVLAHKRRALALKREGNLAEAKEELKKAKLMERQLEEEQMFGGEDEESDEELRALMRGMDKGGMTDTLDVANLDLSMLANVGNINFEGDEGTDVTDVDMDDSEMVAALKAMGWEEEAGQLGRTSAKSRKSRNLNTNVMDVLGENDAHMDGVDATDADMNDPHILSALKAMGFEEEEPSKLIQPVMASIPKSKDKKMLQEEVAFLKREALGLKRAGKLQEAKEELHRARQLEKELKDAESQLNDDALLEAFSVQPAPGPAPPPHGVATVEVAPEGTNDDYEDQMDNVDVTEEDMGDPEMAKILASLGWQDDHESEGVLHEEQIEPSEQKFYAAHQSKSRSELQKELLGVKRAALRLRREGKLDEAEEELKKAHMLEQLMEDAGKVAVVRVGVRTHEEKFDGPTHEEPNMLRSLVSTEDVEIKSQEPRTKADLHPSTSVEVRNQDHFLNINKGSVEVTLLPQKERVEVIPQAEESLGSRRTTGASVEHTTTAKSTTATTLPSPTQEILALKRQALALKHEGKQLEAKEKLREAKALERQLASQEPSVAGWDEATATISEAKPEVATVSGKVRNTSPSNIAAHSTLQAEQVVPATSFGQGQNMLPSNVVAHKSAAAGKDRMKLQQESLAHKRRALALRREGKSEEADGEFELAKSIEKQMEELGGMADGHGSVLLADDGEAVDDIFDVQLLAALKGLGWKESDIQQQPIQQARQDSIEKAVPGLGANVRSTEREQLEVKIRVEKTRAVQLKRSGRQAEALDVLRGAKLLEKRLQALG